MKISCEEMIVVAVLIITIFFSSDMMFNIYK